MRMRALIATTLAVVVLAACGGKDQKAAGSFDAAAELNKVKQVRQELATARAALESARAELQALTAARSLDAAQQARKTELEGQVRQLEARFDEAFNNDQSTLAAFLNVALNDFPQAPETREALRLYAEEAIVNAKDRIARAGDYGRAIELLSTAKGYFEAISAAIPPDLQSTIDQAAAMRYLTRERFDQVKKGMGESDVKLIAGVPFYANIRESEVRGQKVITWLYTRNDGEIAAFYFRGGQVYATKWNVKDQG